MRTFVTFAAASIAIVVCQSASAQTVTRYRFDIPAGPRVQVVRQIAAAAGAAISIADDGDPGLAGEIGPIRGSLTLADALKRALVGSEWYVASAGNEQVRIARSGSGSGDIIVTARFQKSRKEDSNLLTRTDTPLRETPGTVVSVTQAVLQSQNVTSVAEAMKNITGASVTTGPPIQIIARGNSTDGASFTNGLRNSRFGGNPPTIDVAAIEVLKGPSSILTGTAVAGGLVNFVPKEATATSPRQVSLGVGSYGYVRSDMDIGGAISSEDHIYWRAVGISEYARHQNQGGDNPHSNAVALMLGYRNDGWKVDTQTQFYDTTTVHGRPYANDPATKSVEAVDFLNNPDVYYRSKAFSQYAKVEKAVLSNEEAAITLRLRGKYQHADQDYSFLSFSGDISDPLLGTLRAFGASSGSSASDQFSGSADTYARFSTGSVKHQLILAFDYTRERGRYLTLFNSGLYPLSPVPPLLPVPNEKSQYVDISRSVSNEYGVVAQDQISFWRIHALLSVRRSWYDYATTRRTTIVSKVDKTLPSGGVVLDMTKWASVYYSYQKGLTPGPIGVQLIDGSPFPPSITTGHEFGIKTDLNGGKLSITADYFKASTDILNIPNPIDPRFSIAAPGQKRNGFEITAVGKLMPTLFVQTGFAYTTSSSDRLLLGAPKYVANAWLYKNFKLSTIDSLDIGVGGNYQSRTNVASLDLNTFSFNYGPVYRDYLRFDAAVGFTHRNLRLNLTVDNIFDRFNLMNPLIGTALERATGRDVRLVLTVNLPKAE